MRSVDKKLRDDRYRVMFMYLMVVVIAFIIMWRMNDRTSDRLEHHTQSLAAHQDVIDKEVTRRCETANESRREINKRGIILKEFLISEGEARRVTALSTPDAWERVMNAKASSRYEELAGQVADLKYHDCDEDGRPDAP